MRVGRGERGQNIHISSGYIFITVELKVIYLEQDNLVRGPPSAAPHLDSDSFGSDFHLA